MKERDGGAGLMICKLQRSWVEARGNEGTSRTDSVQFWLLSVTNQEINAALFNIHDEGVFSKESMDVVRFLVCNWKPFMLCLNTGHFQKHTILFLK